MKTESFIQHSGPFSHEVCQLRNISKNCNIRIFILSNCSQFVVESVYYVLRSLVQFVCLIFKLDLRANYDYEGSQFY